MKRYIAACLLLASICVHGMAQKKPKNRNDVPAIFQNAHFVYVEAQDGDAMKPGLNPADRQAIFDVQDALHDWNRYALATQRTEADVVLVVRKGRLASTQAHTGVTMGAPRQPGQPASRAPGQRDDQDTLGIHSEVGPENDMLKVCMVNPDGKLSGPLWAREIKDGLDPPQVMIVQLLRTAVERAYPSQPPAQEPAP